MGRILLVCLCLCGVAAADEPPPPDPGSAEWPSGRVVKRSPRNELLVVPRLVLSVPREVVRVVAWPVRSAVQLNARYHIYERVLAAITSEDGLIGVRPAFSFALTTQPSLGVSFFDERIVGPGTSLNARLEVGVTHLVMASARLRPVPAERAATVDLEGAYILRDDQYFGGIQSLSAQDRGSSRFTIDGGDLWLRPGLRLTGALQLVGALQLGVRRYSDGNPATGDAPISRVYCERVAGARCIPGTVDDRLVPGFNAGTQFGRLGLALRVDTFDRPSRPSAGVQLELGGQYTHELADGGGYFGASASVGVAINLWQRTHILLLRARSELVLPVGDGRIPFTELALLGGADSLRGFRAARFRDFSSLLVSAEYRWPIWMWADAMLFADYGGVAGKLYSGLDAGKLYPDVGAGIRVRTRDHVYLRLQLAYGFPDGIQLYLTLGSGS